MDGPPSVARPNLLFVFADEMRASAMGCAGQGSRLRHRSEGPGSPAGSAGNADVRTPALDRLAAEGVRVTLAVANSAVCTPARGSIISGCWPQAHGALANDLPIDPAAPSIARDLNAVGYRCGYIGKWHLGGIPRDRFVPPGPERMGFDAFWAAWNCSHAYFRASYHLDTPQPVSVAGRYEPEAQTDLALDFIARSGGHQGQSPAGSAGQSPAGSAGQSPAGSAGQPWCLFLSYGPPHEPYRPLPPGMEDAYDPAALTLPANCADTAEHRRGLADYYTHVSALDAQVARLLDALADGGQLDDTLVVFTSDHGSMLGSHNRINKHQPWDESTLVPLLLRDGRRLPAGAVQELLVGHVDLAPTLLGLLGVPRDGRMQGLDLSPALLGEPQPLPRSAYLQAVICADQAAKDGILEWRGVRTADATYAEDLRGPWVLYDNRADPFQLRNLVDDPAAAPLRAPLQQELAGWMARTADALEPKEAVLARYGKLGLWQERAAHFAAVRRAAAR